MRSTNTEAVIDIRDVIARFEELENERDDFAPVEGDTHEWDNEAEFETLRALLDELRGYGGDEQWRGDWYPITLIRDSHFKDYAQELAEDIGSIRSDIAWPYTCIDWDRAARELQGDYSTVEFDGVTYWYR